MVKNKLVQPILKWAGGKRYLLPEIQKHLPKNITTYYEPFLGGGAVLFHIQPKKAVVNDINEEIINVYEVVKNNVEGLIKELKKHKNEPEHFYKIREEDRDPNYKNFSNVRKAARIIFLNRTCFNGLFRVNSQGQFNVPFGKYNNPNIVNESVLRAVSSYLRSNDVRFTCGSFENSVKGIKKGALVYLDPPYDPVSDSSSFTGYNLEGFGREDQIKLKEFCDYLHSKGIKFLLSNSATKFIKELYKDYNIEIVKVPRNINADGNKRGKVDEVLVRNYNETD